MARSYSEIKDHSDFLMHYGIPEMKWGVRRYQVAGSSKRTPEGKIRYAHSVSDLANNVYAKAKKVEPKITKDVTSIIRKTGAKVYGLKNRLKTKDSIARKIHDDSKNSGETINKAANSIKDAIRYTVLSKDDDYVSNYNTIKKSLEDLGYSEIRCRNYFDKYRKGKADHKQITSVFSDKDKNTFEIQFQTPSSIKVKEAKTPLYEEVRRTGVTEKRRSEIVSQMNNLAKQVNTPKNVYSIRSHG